MKDIVTHRSLQQSDLVKDAKMDAATELVRGVVSDLLDRNDRRWWNEVETELKTTLNNYKQHQDKPFTPKRIFTSKK